MCGRYVLFSPAEHLAALLRLDDTAAVTLAPRYNVAPSQSVPVVRARRADAGVRRELAGVRWGLIPFWVDDPAGWPKPINARSETAATKPAYREAFRQRRCLVPADGFYEWKKLDDKAKQPMLVRLREDRAFVMPALWERWRDRAASEDAPPLETCAVLTTDPNPLLAPIHDRMPAMLDPVEDRALIDRWLDPAVEEPSELAPCLRPMDQDRMRVHAVSTRVNSPKVDEPSLIEPVEETPAQPGLFG